MVNVHGMYGSVVDGEPWSGGCSCGGISTSSYSGEIAVSGYSSSCCTFGSDNAPPLLCISVDNRFDIVMALPTSGDANTPIIFSAVSTLLCGMQCAVCICGMAVYFAIRVLGLLPISIAIYMFTAFSPSTRATLSIQCNLSTVSVACTSASSANTSVEKHSHHECIPLFLGKTHCSFFFYEVMYGFFWRR